ncbi:MAG: polyphosphate polymerase domain-containing protein [Bacilli bacterium]|nr:polyphosphate polymerase domain-containing protein [Bacilli bacterium]
MPATIFTFQRWEMKFILTQEDFNYLVPIIKANMEPDSYPHYRIRSWYYDTPNHQVSRENLMKPIWKSKLRYRIYVDAENSPKFLELKSKFDGLTYKRRIKVKSLRGALEEAANSDSQIAKEITYFAKTHPGLAPALVITYDRLAFHDDITDTRLTIDRDVFAGVVPLIDDDCYIMEVKVTMSLPRWLLDALEERKLYQRSFSKFKVANVVSSAVTDAAEQEDALLNSVRGEGFK